MPTWVITYLYQGRYSTLAIDAMTEGEALKIARKRMATRIISIKPERTPA